MENEDSEITGGLAAMLDRVAADELGTADGSTIDLIRKADALPRQ